MERQKRSWLTRREKVELFEQIRREYEFGVGTIAGVSRKLGVHRRMVREALRSAEPATSRPQQRRLRKLDAASEFIDRVLRGDLEAPPKQRHTAHRIWHRLCAELPSFSGSERTVRGYVQRRRQQLGLERREVFVPQSYAWGSEAQVDWYEAWAVLSGERIKLQVFEMRSMASGAAYHRAYTHAMQQAFLEAHQLGFGYFGGVFRTLRYDNLKAAVKRILRGHRREETSRFIAFRSHWRFQGEFCNPARGNEKGGIECEGGYFRRNHWVPLPEARDLDELNAYLERCCREDQGRILSGRTETVGAAMLAEQPHLLPLAAEPFELAEIGFPTVDGLRCVRVRTNRYSAPLKPGTKVEARVYADTVELWHEGRRVARHERSYSRQQQVLDLEHYLDVLERKPGALAGSTPLAQWRQAGRWPESFDRLWQALNTRHGRQQGSRQMIELLQLGTGQGWNRLETAVEQTLSLGCHDVAAIRHLLMAGQFERPEIATIELGGLARYERPMPVLSDYDQLLGQANALEVQA
jgi:transposase